MMDPKLPTPPQPDPSALERAQARLLAELSRLPAETTLEAAEPGPCRVEWDGTQAAWEAGPGAADPDPTRYRFGPIFARGGLGAVRRALDRKLGRVVAVKELLRFDERSVQRFVREATITARLQHPGIVPLYDLGRDPEGRPFLCMRLVEGASLGQRLAACDDLSARLALLPHLIAAADAMAYAHRRQIVHRDLKPDNILVGEFGETVVIDWGLAKDLSDPSHSGDPERDLADAPIAASDLTLEGSLLGTLRYMPPEQARGELVDARSDVYALGAALYHLLAGAPPFHDRRAAQLLHDVLEARPAPIAERAPAAPRGLIAIADKSMSKRPGDRYQSAAALAEDLRRFQAGRLVDAHSYSLPEIGRLWITRHRALTVLSASALAALLLGGAASFAQIRAARDLAHDQRAAALNAQRLAERRALETEGARRLAQDRADELILAQARQHLDRDPGAALRALAQLSPAALTRATARLFAEAALARGGESITMTGPEGPVSQVIHLADGSWVATAGGELWRWSPGEREGERLGPAAALARAPNGRTWAAIRGDGLELHALGQPEPTRLALELDRPLLTTWTLPDDRRLIGASALRRPTVEIDLQRGRSAEPPESALPALQGLQLYPAPDGHTHAGLRERALVLWDRRSDAVHEHPLPGRPVGQPLWGPSSDTLLLALATDPSPSPRDRHRTTASAPPGEADQIWIWTPSAPPRLVYATRAAPARGALIFLDAAAATPRAWAEDLAGATLWTRDLRTQGADHVRLGPVVSPDGHGVRWRFGDAWELVDVATGALLRRHPAEWNEALWQIDDELILPHPRGMTRSPLRAGPWTHLAPAPQGGPARSVALSRGWAARAAEDGRVERIQLDTGAITQLPPGCPTFSAPPYLTLADDGRLLLADDSDRACLWGHGPPIPLKLPGERVVGAYFRPQGRFSLALAGGELLTYADPHKPPTVHRGAPIGQIDATSDHLLLLIQPLQEPLTLIGLSGEHLPLPAPDDPSVYQGRYEFALHPRAESFALSPRGEGAIQLIHLASGARRRLAGPLPAPLPRDPPLLRFTPDGGRLVRLGGGQLLTWELQGGPDPRRIHGVTGRQLYFLGPTAALVITDDGALELIDLEAGASAPLRPGDRGPAYARLLPEPGGFLHITTTGELLRWRAGLPSTCTQGQPEDCRDRALHELLQRGAP